MRRGLAVIAMTSTLVACRGEAPADEAAPSASTAAETGITAGGGDAAEVPSALDFEAPLIDGTTFDARQYAGETVVFWFWAPF